VLCGKAALLSSARACSSPTGTPFPYLRYSNRIRCELADAWGGAGRVGGLPVRCRCLLALQHLHGPSRASPQACCTTALTLLLPRSYRVSQCSLFAPASQHTHWWYSSVTLRAWHTGLLESSKANKERYNQDRLESYYRRNLRCALLPTCLAFDRTALIRDSFTHQSLACGAGSSSPTPQVCGASQPKRSRGYGSGWPKTRRSAPAQFLMRPGSGAVHMCLAAQARRHAAASDSCPRLSGAVPAEVGGTALSACLACKKFKKGLHRTCACALRSAATCSASAHSSAAWKPSPTSTKTREVSGTSALHQTPAPSSVCVCRPPAPWHGAVCLLMDSA